LLRAPHPALVLCAAPGMLARQHQRRIGPCRSPRAPKVAAMKASDTPGRVSCIQRAIAAADAAADFRMSASSAGDLTHLRRALCPSHRAWPCRRSEKQGRRAHRRGCRSWRRGCTRPSSSWPRAGCKAARSAAACHAGELRSASLSYTTQVLPASSAPRRVSSCAHARPRRPRPVCALRRGPQMCTGAPLRWGRPRLRQRHARPPRSSGWRHPSAHARGCCWARTACTTRLRATRAR